MRKKLALFLVVALFAIGVVGCGSNDPAKTPSDTDTTDVTDKVEEDKEEATGDTGDKELTVAWWGNQARNDRTIATLDLYSEKNPGVIFDGQFSEWADYWNKLAIASAGNNLPDVVQMDYRYLEQYVGNDLLVDLRPYIESGALDVSAMDPGILDSGSVGEGIYAICIGINAPSLQYNKTALDEAGITVKDNMTMDEFMDLSREVHEKTGYKTSIAYDDGANFIEYYMRASDVVLYQEEKLGVDSPEELLPYFDLYTVALEEGWHIAPDVYAEISAGSVEQSPLVYGSSPETMSWCSFSNSNQLTAAVNAAPEGMELGITTWPSPNPKKSNYLKPGQFMSVTRDSKNPEESAKLLDFFTNSVEANEILLAERGVPVSPAVADAIAPLISETEVRIGEYINQVVTPNSSTINPPPAEGANEVYDLLNSLVEKIAYKQITAQEAANEFFEKGNEILARN